MDDFKDKFRQHLHMIWEISALDQEGLRPEDQLLAEIMQLHPEYFEVWEQLDTISDEDLLQDEVNPVLHVLVHQIVENQVADRDPPQTAETLDQLMQQGLTRHEAVHEIGSVVTDTLFTMLQSQQTFDEQQYVQKLRWLVKPRRRRRRRR